MKIIFLGTGTSYGVPMIGCECSVCVSDNPKNSRTRSSILISRGEHNILIDTATELRIQCLSNKVKRVNAVLLTHAHADHILGLDDLRHFNLRHKINIPVYGSQETVNQIKKMFSYVFDETVSNGSKPKFTMVPVDGPFTVLDVEIVPIAVMHGSETVNGYRIDDVAYVTDVSHIPPDSMDKLRGLDLLILDALRLRPHEKHFSIEQSLDIVTQLKPEQAIFTHMAHEVDHDQISRTLPEGIKLAYDGLWVEV
ncbi:MAG: MBL fold metallo-hydrolase [Planctomycetes bacterium]|nr:MBL fold metallo-hydrolase [Planctomycetota bacterium]